MAALVGNLVVGIFGFSGVAIAILLGVMAIAFVIKAIAGK